MERNKGRTSNNTKDEENGIMGSAIQRKEFCFGLELTSDEQDIVNNFCRTHWLHYMEADTALKLNGRTEKGNIGQNPFAIFCEYGYSA